jgi:1,4-alpha-glucan branching enzyme
MMTLESQTPAKLQGMGAMPHDEGTAFRVWAPHAQTVAVVGTFNDWNDQTHSMESEENGYWYIDVTQAKVGDEYRFVVTNGDQILSRIDPYAREVTNSSGNGVVSDSWFEWRHDNFKLPPREQLVIYELHIGTFGRSSQNPDQVADFAAATRRLDYLKELGINCIEVMPVAEFAGDCSWGYNPAQPFAVESAYGGPKAFKNFIREAHQRGIGVILDVVYNHFGPGDLSLWQFDGWSQDGKGGIYFYNDWRSATPWGETRPDFGRPEVRQYVRDNAVMWIDEFHLDGLRFDMTLFIRHVRGDGDPGASLPDGWSLAQWINDEVRTHWPHAITIAEDLQNHDGMTKSTSEGGAGFSLQWDAGFVHPIRNVLIAAEDDQRSMGDVRSALEHMYNGDWFQRVIYTESHDEVANGKARVPEEIDGDEGADWFARKRSTLGAVLVMTTPGVPMLFQGQEFLQDGWFQDTLPLDWSRTQDFQGIVRLYRDLIHWRSNASGQCPALCGSGLEVFLQDDDARVLGFKRWHHDEPDDSLLVILNFRCTPQKVWTRLPQGHWVPVFNSDAKFYGKDFSDHVTPAVDSQGDIDHEIWVGPYSAVIFRNQATTEPVEAVMPAKVPA